MTKENKRVIVLSRNYSNALGVVRSLGNEGYEVDLISIVQRKGSSKICASSKYVNKATEIPYSQATNKSGAVLVDAILAFSSKTKKNSTVLFPTDDFTAEFIDKNRNQLEQFFLMPYIKNTENTISSLMNKVAQSKMASDSCLCTPLQWVINLKNEIVIPENVKYPCFVKPIQSISGSKKEMRRIENEGELVFHLEKMKTNESNRDVLVQEFLDIEQEYDLSALCFGNKIIIPGIIRKTEVAQYSKGVTMSGIMEKAAILGPQLENVKKMLQSLEFVGMVDLELNKVGDSLFFGEVNLRSGGPNYAYFKSGINLPALLVKELINGKHHESDEEINDFGKSFIYEKVAWEDYIHGYISKADLNNRINHADFTLLADEDDPMPGIVFNRKIRLSAIKQRVLNILKR